MRLQVGDVFSLKTKLGFGFIQFVTTFDDGIECIRVLEPIKDSNEISQAEVDLHERFVIQFPVKAAFRKKIITKVAQLSVPSIFKIPSHFRSQHNVRGVCLGWHIVDRFSLQRKLIPKLDNQRIELSPHGIFNDTLLIEYLEIDWRLENWK